MNKQRLSIAMCTCNGAKYLDEQLASIAAQTRLPDEVIICDDVSTDGTLALLKNWAKLVKFPVKIRRNTKRLGIPKNFEKAISLCSGDLIALSDADDIWKRNKLQMLEQALAEHPDAGYAFSDRILINERGKIIHSSYWKIRGFNEKKRAVFSKSCADQLKVWVKNPAVGGATMIFRGSLSAKILPIPELWNHDDWILLICTLVGRGGIAIPEALIYHRRHPAQYTASRLRNPVLWYLKRTLEIFLNKAEGYDDKLCKWDVAYTLLSKKIADYQDHEAFQMFKKLVNHFTFRSKLYDQPRLSRLAPVIAELKSGRYHSYSVGMKSVIKDLLIKTCFEKT